jgi:uncharacterized delta-60 repeat protein
MRFATLGFVSIALWAGGAEASPGMLDPTFGTGGKVVTDFGPPHFSVAEAVALQPNGEIIAAGFTNDGGTVEFALAGYTPNGNLAANFGNAGLVRSHFGSASFDERLNAMAIEPNGNIVVAGSTFGLSVGSIITVVRYLPDGSLDTSFGAGGMVWVDQFGVSSDDNANAVAIQKDGKIVVGGFTNAFGSVDFAVVRLRTDGSLDPTFGSGGKVFTDLGGSEDIINALVIQKDGKIVVAGGSNGGGSSTFAVARYETDGSLDASFGFGGTVYTAVAATSTEELATAMVLQKDGNIIVGGYSNEGMGTPTEFVLARYDTNGSLDASFGSGGVVLTPIGTSPALLRGLAIRNGKGLDGNIVAVGTGGANVSFAILRYRFNGSLDPTFGTGGIVLTNFGIGAEAHAAALTPDGRVVAAGLEGQFQQSFALARYLH